MEWIILIRIRFWGRVTRIHVTLFPSFYWNSSWRTYFLKTSNMVKENKKFSNIHFVHFIIFLFIKTSNRSLFVRMKPISLYRKIRIIESIVSSEYFLVRLQKTLRKISIIPIFRSWKSLFLQVFWLFLENSMNTRDSAHIYNEYVSSKASKIRRIPSPGSILRSNIVTRRSRVCSYNCFCTVFPGAPQN